MSEEDTYLRAKLTEINGAIERLTDMLNKMIEVISHITEVEDSTTTISAAVAKNSAKLDEVIRLIENLDTARPGASGTGLGIEDKGAITSLTAVIDTLESQVREGVIASDLAQKISESADILEDRGLSGPVVVKMNRWVRILKTYGRVDGISPQDLGKLREDLKEWRIEIGARR